MKDSRAASAHKPRKEPSKSDNTRRAEEALRQSEERYRTLFNLGPVAVYSIDTSGVIQNFNRRAGELWGREPVLGDTDQRFCGSFKMFRSDGSFMPHEQCPMAEVVSGKISAAHDAEVLIERPDGSSVTVVVNIRTLKNERGEVTGAINCFYDITERKRTEQALRESQALLANRAEQLEQLVAERTAKLQETVGELEHVSHGMVHDMRAPLRAMQGFAQMLEADSAAVLPEQRSDYVRRIITAAARLDKLIQDGLTYNKAVLLEVALIPIDLSSLVKGILDTYPNLHPEKADITIDGRLPVVIGNEALLTQCFSNLLGNAVKFVAPGVHPQIRLWSEAVESVTASERKQSPLLSRRNQTKSDASFVRIWISDNGIGIPIHAQGRLFRMFQRLVNDYEGTGIGLAIVRKVVERMGGRIGADSYPGKGSRFWVELQSAAPLPNHFDTFRKPKAKR